ncbi:hypothetical protein ON010_g3140 [Phytophthora cinnamomi]|nr:hypothetical protein ON010_g3140 [Phytophthora cinnamomi]
MQHPAQHAVHTASQKSSMFGRPLPLLSPNDSRCSRVQHRTGQGIGWRILSAGNERQRLWRGALPLEGPVHSCTGDLAVHGRVPFGGGVLWLGHDVVTGTAARAAVDAVSGITVGNGVAPVVAKLEVAVFAFAVQVKPSEDAFEAVSHESAMERSRCLAATIRITLLGCV